VRKETPQPLSWLTGYASICIPRLDGRVEVDKFAQLDGLTDGVAIAHPQLDDIRGSPSLDIKDTIVKLLSTFLPRRVSKVQVLLGSLIW
jgi:hypothetical protein